MYDIDRNDPLWVEFEKAIIDERLHTTPRAGADLLYLIATRHRDEAVAKAGAELEAATGTVFFLRGEVERYQAAFDDAMKLAASHAADLARYRADAERLEAKLAETPWEVSAGGDMPWCARFSEQQDAEGFYREWGGSIRNAITGEEVK